MGRRHKPFNQRVNMMSYTVLSKSRIAARRIAMAFLVSGVMMGAASAQDLVPFKIASQSPPIFEYVYINYAIEGGFLKKGGPRCQIRRLHRRLTTTQAIAGGSLDAACDGVTGTLSRHREGLAAQVVYAVNADNTYVVVSRDNHHQAERSQGQEMGDHANGRDFADLRGALAQQERAAGRLAWTGFRLAALGARARAVIANQVDVTLLTVGEWIRIQEQKGVRFGDVSRIIAAITAQSVRGSDQANQRASRRGSESSSMAYSTRFARREHLKASAIHQGGPADRSIRLYRQAV